MDAEGFRKTLIEKIKQDFIMQDANKFEKRARLTQIEAQQKFKKLVDIINLVDKELDIQCNQKVQQELDKKIRRTLMVYPELLTVQDEHKQNIGIICAKFGLEQSVLVALQSNEASLQQDEDCRNIGMHCALSSLTKSVIKSMQNKKTCEQVSKYGETIQSLYKQLSQEFSK